MPATISPQWIARAPGRVNLIGGHTDYNGGFVLPMAVERYTEIAAAPNESTVIRLLASDPEDAVAIDLSTPVEPRARGHWANDVAGVIAGFLRAGYRLPGFDAVIRSDVPNGCGRALDVATATLLEAVTGSSLVPWRKAALCREARQAFAGVPCEIMDPFISTLAREGHVTLLDCLTDEAQHLEFSDPAIAVLVIDTNVRHELASTESALRRAQCERAARELQLGFLRDADLVLLERHRELLGEVVYRRARHVVTENDRARCAARAIRERSWIEVGHILYESHDSLRYDFRVTCPELDAVVEIAQELGHASGVFGCRMTGEGFGGCAVALIEAEKHASIARVLTDEYRDRIGREPTLFASRPARGAWIVKG